MKYFIYFAWGILIALLFFILIIKFYPALIMADSVNQNSYHEIVSLRIEAFNLNNEIDKEISMREPIIEAYKSLFYEIERIRAWNKSIKRKKG